jgi:secretion/DNA translocation related TadE-like protein
VSTPTTNRRPVLSRLGDDSGAVSVIAVALLSVGATTTVAVAGVASCLVDRHRLGGAADAAALAAADAASGLVAGEPCAAAALLADGNSVGLASCVVEGSTVTVTVVSTLAGLPIEAAATAGQPTSEGRNDIDASKK